MYEHDCEINIFDKYDGAEGCELDCGDHVVHGEVLRIDEIPEEEIAAWVAVSNAAEALKNPFNKMKTSLNAVLTNFQEALLNDYLTLIGAYPIPRTVKDRRRYRAYLRSKRNQEHPLKMKKCKHGRTYRTRRRK